MTALNVVSRTSTKIRVQVPASLVGQLGSKTLTVTNGSGSDAESLDVAYPIIREGSTAASGSGSATLSLPPHQSTDELVLVSGQRGAVGISTPSGWTKQADVIQPNDLRLQVYTKNSVVGQEVWGPAGSLALSSGGEFGVICFAVGGGSYGTDGTDASVAVENATSPSIATAGDGLLVLAIECTSDGDGATPDLPTGFDLVRTGTVPGSRLLTVAVTRTYSDPSGGQTWGGGTPHSTKWATATIEMVPN